MDTVIKEVNLWFETSAVMCQEYSWKEKGAPASCCCQEVKRLFLNAESVVYGF